MAKRTIFVAAAFRIALLLGGVFTTPALAIGSDVVHYPTVEAHRSETMERHYDTGVPVPRVRVFGKASGAPFSASRGRRSSPTRSFGVIKPTGRRVRPCTAQRNAPRDASPYRVCFGRLIAMPRTGEGVSLAQVPWMP
jgi:hypothetical protein